MQLTLRFVDEKQVTGRTGCNRYFGMTLIDDESITISGLVSTRRACAPALMHQEQRLLDALRAVSRYRMDQDPWLFLFDEEGMQRLKLFEIQFDPAAESANRAGPPKAASTALRRSVLRM
jgi:heat shock protein HslJ